MIVPGIFSSATAELLAAMNEAVNCENSFVLMGDSEKEFRIHCISQSFVCAVYVTPAQSVKIETGDIPTMTWKEFSQRLVFHQATGIVTFDAPESGKAYFLPDVHKDITSKYFRLGFPNFDRPGEFSPLSNFPKKFVNMFKSCMVPKSVEKYVSNDEEYCCLCGTERLKDIPYIERIDWRVSRLDPMVRGVHIVHGSLMASAIDDMNWGLL